MNQSDTIITLTIFSIIFLFFVILLMVRAFEFFRNEKLKNAFTNSFDLGRIAELQGDNEAAIRHYTACAYYLTNYNTGVSFQPNVFLEKIRKMGGKPVNSELFYNNK